MTEKYCLCDDLLKYCYSDISVDENHRKRALRYDEVVKILNEQEEEIKQLKKDVEYWKQVASQYSNELNVFEHFKNHKTKCKDIYWSSDVDD